MPRPNHVTRPHHHGAEDRKSIEQRARDAAAPYAPEKKGHWPFPVEPAGDSENDLNAGQPFRLQ